LLVYATQIKLPKLSNFYLTINPSFNFNDIEKEKRERDFQQLFI